MPPFMRISHRGISPHMGISPYMGTYMGISPKWPNIDILPNMGITLNMGISPYMGILMSYSTEKSSLYTS